MKTTATNKCIWIVDTIRQHKAITLKDLNVLWLASDNSNGKPLSRAGFYCLRKAAQELFGVTISTNLSTFEYYIEEDTKNYRNSTVSDWLLNTSILNDALMGAGEVASRIELEYVPSAKEYLKPIIKALQENKLISIDYQPFTKNVPTTDIKLAPYFLKIFKQRWYVIGKHMGEQKIKTYALDRIVRLDVTDISYAPDRSLTPENYFRDLFGIESNRTDTVEVRIKAKERDAKYLRALPLHHSQEELVDVGYSIFVYKLKITNDLVRELLSMGRGIEVIAPKELRLMMEDTLTSMLSNYGYTCYPPVIDDEDGSVSQVKLIGNSLDKAVPPTKDTAQEGDGPSEEKETVTREKGPDAQESGDETENITTGQQAQEEAEASDSHIPSEGAADADVSDESADKIGK